ncbi:glycosyltransferase family 9 protein, partial [Vibrio sp. 10N.261.45.F1]
IKAKVKLGFSWTRAKEGQWLFTNRKLPKTDASHVLDNFSEFAYFLGCSKQVPTWDLALSDEDQRLSMELAHEPYIVISPAASKDERNWLVERYAAVADHAYQLGFKV